ncbi:MAG: hypothetical protein OSB39_08225 [Opitutales bacterium]|nr:hypothetical protein [Opitutales bacterium]
MIYRYLPFFSLSSFAITATAQIDFQKEVLPILQDRCIECHKAPYEQNGKLKEPKAGLRLDGVVHILHGSDDGKVIAPNHPSESPLYKRITLPSDDDDVMPPKGDPLTASQQGVIRKWIAQGVDFGTWVGATDGTEKFAESVKAKVKYSPAHHKFYDEMAKGLKPLSEDVLRRVRESTGALVRPIGIGNPLLEVRFLAESASSGDDDLVKLAPLRQHLCKLDLARTQVTSECFATIKTFPRIRRLDLRDTQISDANLEGLAQLKYLSYLNLGGTEVGDAGLRKLVKCKSLREIYLWKSSATSQGAEALRKRIPELKTRI